MRIGLARAKKVLCPGTFAIRTTRAIWKARTWFVVAVIRVSPKQVKQQGFDIVIDEIQQITGLAAWESEGNAGADRDGPLMPTFHLFSDDVEAEIALIAATTVYPNDQQDLLAVVQSLRVL